MFGKLSQIFGKKERLLEPLDMGRLHTDVHSHFIPGIDDGADSMETSLELLRGMAELGYKKVITTPHVMSDYYRNTSDMIRKGCDELREAVQEAGIALEIDCAAEYYLDMEFMQLIKQKDILTFGDKHVLFELPFLSEPPNVADAVFELQMAGYKPVLAHPERYAYWHLEFEKYQTMLDKGVILQLNINSLTGHYSPEVKKVAQRLINDEMIQLLGSDCHHTGHIGLFQHAVRTEYLHQAVDQGKLLNPSL